MITRNNDFQKQLKTEIPHNCLSIYPNPSSEIITVKYEIEKRTRVFISIIDLTGRSVISIPGEIKQVGSYKEELVIDGLKNGYHLVTANVGGYDYVRKLI